MNNKKSERKKEASSEKVHSVKNLIYFPRIVFSFFVFLIIFISPLLIISGSKSFYQNNINEECFPMISEKDCRDLQQNAREYLKGDAELDERYSVQEQSHFADVKKIIDFGRVLVFTLLFFTVIYFLMLYFFDKTEIFRTMKLAGIISVSFLLILLIAISISFNGTFFLFHALLFPQGNWTFPFDSTIIVVFSQQFFVHAAVVSFLLSLGAGFVLLGVGHLIIYMKNNK